MEIGNPLRTVYVEPLEMPEPLRDKEVYKPEEEPEYAEPQPIDK